MTSDDERQRLADWFDDHDHGGDVDARAGDGPPGAGSSGPALGEAEIPLGGAFWRRLGGDGGAGAFWWVSVGLAAALAAWVLVVGGWVIHGARHGDPVPAADTWGLVAWLGVVIGGIVIMSLVWIAELGRRGRIVRSGQPQTHWLPQGSNVARMHQIGPGWHVGWLLTCLALTALFVVVGFDGDWFGDGDDGGFGVLWAVLSLVTGFVSGVLCGSLVKKANDRRRTRAGLAPARRASAFWRWFDFRWRFDLWLCGTGALLLTVAAGIAWLTSTPDPAAGPHDAEHFSLVVRGGVVGGAVLLGLGVWAGTQYWRSGQDLSTGESFA